jgi:hypothetical protein
MRTIFISYRRSDAAETAGRMYDRLKTAFGPERIFKDVDSIPLDSLFRPYVLEKIATSVVLALIGPQWTTCTDAQGARRLHSENDLVRQEIETAIDCGVPLIPVPVLKAPMPRAEELPESIRSLVEREAHDVRPDPDFHNDMDRLIARLEPLTGKAGASSVLPHGLIEQVLDDCQGWHTEIVHAIAKIQLHLAQGGDAAPAQVHATDFVYQNTRKFLPRLQSARATLAQFEGTDRLAWAVDAFMALVSTRRPDRDDAMCLSLTLPDLGGPSLLPGSTPLTDPVFLLKLNLALQGVSDAVAALAAGGTDRASGRVQRGAMRR